MKRSPMKRPTYERPPRQPATPIVGCRGVYASASNEVVSVQKETLLRSEPYRRYVAAQECFSCRVERWSQCAHANLLKGLGLKVCDSRTFPLCTTRFGLIGCHELFDLGIEFGNREERRDTAEAWTHKMQERAKADGWDMKTLRRVA